MFYSANVSILSVKHMQLIIYFHILDREWILTADNNQNPAWADSFPENGGINFRQKENPRGLY